jgi:hypothetical protein
MIPFDTNLLLYSLNQDAALSSTPGSLSRCGITA